MDFFSLFFIGEPFVKQKCENDVNPHCEGDPCSRWFERKIFSFASLKLKGVIKDDIFLFYDKETWSDIIFKTW